MLLPNFWQIQSTQLFLQHSWWSLRSGPNLVWRTLQQETKMPRPSPKYGQALVQKQRQSGSLDPFHIIPCCLGWALLCGELPFRPCFEWQNSSDWRSIRQFGKQCLWIVDGISLLLRSFLEAVSNEERFVWSWAPMCCVACCILRFQYERPSGPHSWPGLGLQTDMGLQSHLWTSVLAIEDDQQHRLRHLFISNVLPFGPSNSVDAFSLIARSLRIIGESLFALISPLPKRETFSLDKNPNPGLHRPATQCAQCHRHPPERRQVV